MPLDPAAQAGVAEGPPAVPAGRRARRAGRGGPRPSAPGGPPRRARAGAATSAGSPGASDHGQIVNSVSPTRRESPSVGMSWRRAPAIHLVVSPPRPSRWSRSWLPEQTRSGARSRIRRKYFCTTMAWACRPTDGERRRGGRRRARPRRRAPPPRPPSRTCAGRSAGRRPGGTSSAAPSLRACASLRPRDSTGGRTAERAGPVARTGSRAALLRCSTVPAAVFKAP